jgi:glycosyltransferase involved in cell wall biosynthesis
MPIRFSVIIPNYNHAPFLQQRIDSILNQTWQYFEVIILDDASEDNSKEIIESYRNHEKVKAIEYNQMNSGRPSLQWKKGIGLAENEWVWIAESDDFAAPNYLQEAAKSIEANPDLAIFYSDGYIVDKMGNYLAQTFSLKKNRDFNMAKWSNPYVAEGIDEINECMKFDCTINNVSGIVFRKTLFDTDIQDLYQFKYYGDWYFGLLACFLGKVSYSPKPLNYYRKHADSHLNKKTSIVTSRSEYFKILALMFYRADVTNKKDLLDHFVFYYLNFGLFQDGWINAAKIVSQYIKFDPSLAFKVIWRIFKFRISHKKPKISFS